MMGLVQVQIKGGRDAAKLRLQGTSQKDESKLITTLKL